MSPKLAFFIPHVLFSILMEHFMGWQIGELMTDAPLRRSGYNTFQLAKRFHNNSLEDLKTWL